MDENNSSISKHENNTLISSITTISRHEKKDITKRIYRHDHERLFQHSCILTYILLYRNGDDIIEKNTRIVHTMITFCAQNNVAIDINYVFGELLGQKK